MGDLINKSNPGELRFNYLLSLNGTAPILTEVPYPLYHTYKRFLTAIGTDYVLTRMKYLISSETLKIFTLNYCTFYVSFMHNKI